MAMTNRSPLVLTPFQNYASTDHCGYCSLDQKPLPLGNVSLPGIADAPETPVHYSIGSQIIVMSCEDYEKCMNMGYRRSGVFLYKGDMLRGCCRMYTIRTNLEMMKISKEHRQVVNRFKKAIADAPEDVPTTDNATKKQTSKKGSKSFDLSSLIEAEQKSSRFKTFFEPAQYSEEKYQLYRKYQMIVHNDKPEDVTPSGFSSFLIQTPFSRDELLGEDEDWDHLDNWVKNWKRGTVSEKTKRVGPSHECYYLDGKLIAISVIDFLPNSLSSVYFIWDPDYAHLSLGTLLSLREIQMCHELGIQHYYLGYYISDCAKMRYKGKFGGELLDPCNQVFVPFNKALPLIENDQLWTLGNIENPADELLEPNLDLRGCPGVFNKEAVNKAQAIYGYKAVYESAQKALQNFKKKIEIDKMEVPAVIPGSIPLSQALEVFEKLNMELDVGVFTSIEAERRKFKDLNPEQRLIIVDAARMLGFELLTNRVIITLPE